MSNFSSNPIDALQKRFMQGSLHHGILLLSKSVELTEHSAHLLATQILSLQENQSEHPDLFHLRPAGKARIISVEKTRELIATLNRTSNQGGCKVAIIHEADRMRKEAANAFLKTLEEPPPDTYLLLLSSTPYSLLATIRSRCLLARLPEPASSRTDSNWNSWVKNYHAWISGLLNRENLRKDKVSPLFNAYGLMTSLLGLINHQSEICVKENKVNAERMDDKERDAYEVGVRRGVRSKYFNQLSDATRSFITLEEHNPHISKLGIKLSRVLHCLEKNVRLMEVNLKDEAAIEDFYLSSLRIWSAK